MNRKDQIEKAAETFSQYTDILLHRQKAFVCGAEWADANPETSNLTKEDIADFKLNVLKNDDLKSKLAIAVEALEFYQHLEHDQDGELWWSNGKEKIDNYYHIPTKAIEALLKIKGEK